MLLQFRKLSRGAAATIIVGLIGVATVMFLIPSGGLQFGGAQHLAKVGGHAITPAQLTRELELTLRAQRNQGNNVSRADAIEAGVHLRLLDSIIGRTALYAYAEKIGVGASDAQVGQRIREIPATLNPVTGAFDEAAYQAFLGQLGYDHGEFVEDIRGEMATQMLMEALVSGLRAPSSYGALALSYQGETRVVSIAEAPASALGAIAAPTAAQIQTLYEESQEQLRVPEYRALTLVYARPQDFAARVEVPEQRLREEFEARRPALTQPERRTYVRLSAQSEQQANDAAARLGRGETPAAIAAALGVQTSRGENQARSEVPDARVADAVFTAARGAPRVVRGQLTPWAVVQVETITASVEPSFAALRGELRQAIAADEAGELLNTAIGAFEDARAGGASVADAARQNGLAIVTVAAVDAQGLGQDGAPVAALTGQADLLSNAFETPEGEASDFVPAADADVIVAVDRIIAPSVRPLAEVSAQLAQLWTARERARRLREAGEQMVEAVRGGQAFAATARARRFNIVVASRPVDRRAAAQIPARGLAAQIFAAREGALVSDVRADGGAVLVAIVERINRVDPAAAPQEVEAARAQLQEGLGNSFGEAVQAEIVARARPERNEELIARVYPSETGETEAAQ
ncbi:MAG: peptidylprolyl isomerase [Terricaulis sp.]